MKKHFLSFIVCIVLFASCDINEPTNKKDSGIGKFSVSESKQVTFSPGNLQYYPKHNLWRFAESQLDYIGESNKNISDTYNGWIDLFGWGTGANPTERSKNFSDYSVFIDWGTNVIDNDAPNTWRTITTSELCYLLYERYNADSLIGIAQIDSINGMIILPDSWICPSNITFKPGLASENDYAEYAKYQTFTISEWAKLEQNGALFLPAAGRRGSSDVGAIQWYGYYWLADVSDEYESDNFFFRSDFYQLQDNDCYRGYSVRLVKDL